MDWLKILSEIFTVCIIPLLGILTKYIISYIEVKKGQLINEQEDAIRQKYIKMLAETIETCVIATNQTYVDNLKNKDAFTKEAQLEAFNKTKAAIVSIIGEEGQKYLAEIYGDLNEYITKEIEKQVNLNKKPVESVG